MSVSSLPVQVKVPFAPDADIVKHLEMLLELAKSGKLRGVASAYVLHDDLTEGGAANYAWAGKDAAWSLTRAISLLCYKWEYHNYEHIP